MSDSNVDTAVNVGSNPAGGPQAHALSFWDLCFLIGSSDAFVIFGIPLCPILYISDLLQN